MERTSVTNSEAIWNRACADLAIPTEQGDPDPILWEHSVRVARYAGWIAKLPEARGSSLDETAVLAAALYHDAGWVTRLRDGEIGRDEILLRPYPDNHHEQGALLLRASLSELMTGDSLASASNAIRTLGARGSDSVEGRILSDADNLDEFGIPSLWLMVRRGALIGKGVQAVIETWRRKKEYRFWNARLRDSFWFGQVREAAEKRLMEFDRLMRELEEQHNANDLEQELGIA
jgi:hypothetical protein